MRFGGPLRLLALLKAENEGPLRQLSEPTAITHCGSDGSTLSIKQMIDGTLFEGKGSQQPQGF